MVRLSTLNPQVGFGTSGVRALIEDLTAPIVWGYVRSFVRHLKQSEKLAKTRACIIGWDLRPSSLEIAAFSAAAIKAEGLEVEFAGEVPTPTLALHAIKHQMPAVMVTGSHIPFDRNGVKFFTSRGEITKRDEISISRMDVAELMPASGFCDTVEHLGLLGEAKKAAQIQSRCASQYRERYLGLVNKGALEGLKLGVYQHSSVARDLLTGILKDLGADVVVLGRSDGFVAIDTEAVSIEDEQMAARWCKEHDLDAVISTDGDGDRPWVCDERGRFVRGDLLGALTARWLGAKAVVSPISSSTAIERSGFFERCERTKIGSPYVIEAMERLAVSGQAGVVGFEANGGFLVRGSLRGLDALPTRDSALPIIALLCMAQECVGPISALLETLPKRVTKSDRLKNLPTEASKKLISTLLAHPDTLAEFMSFVGHAPTEVNQLDGLRVYFGGGDIVHLRPSGNAPELRCYVESESLERAQRLLDAALKKISQKIQSETSS